MKPKTVKRLKELGDAAVIATIATLLYLGGKWAWAKLVLMFAYRGEVG